MALPPAAWPGPAHSVAICEGLEDWAAATDFSNISDSDEEDDDQLAPLVRLLSCKLFSYIFFFFFRDFFLSLIFTQFHLVKFFPNFLPFSCPAGTESWWRAAWPALMTSSSTAVTSLSWCTRTRQECGKEQHEDTIRKRGSRPLWGPGPPACFY